MKDGKKETDSQGQEETGENEEARFRQYAGGGRRLGDLGNGRAPTAAGTGARKPAGPASNDRDRTAQRGHTAVHAPGTWP